MSKHVQQWTAAALGEAPVMAPNLLGDLLDRWAADEARLRELGQDGIAAVIARLRSELAEQVREAELHLISAEEAAARSGYSRSALRKMKQEGRLSDVGRGHYVSSELPRKAKKRSTGPRLAGDLADQAVLDRARARSSGGTRPAGCPTSSS